MHPNESNRIDRRTVLRGMGAAIALPWLEVMTPDRFAAAGSLLSPVTPAAASPLHTDTAPQDREDRGGVDERS